MAKKKATKKSTRGGYREGSGRKPLEDDQKTTKVSMRLPQDVIAFITDKKNGKTQAAAVVHAVRTCPDYEKNMGD